MRYIVIDYAHVKDTESARIIYTNHTEPDFVQEYCATLNRRDAEARAECRSRFSTYCTGKAEPPDEVCSPCKREAEVWKRT